MEAVEKTVPRPPVENKRQKSGRGCLILGVFGFIVVAMFGFGFWNLFRILPEISDYFSFENSDTEITSQNTACDEKLDEVQAIYDECLELLPPADAAPFEKLRTISTDRYRFNYPQYSLFQEINDTIWINNRIGFYLTSSDPELCTTEFEYCPVISNTEQAVINGNDVDNDSGFLYPTDGSAAQEYQRSTFYKDGIFYIFILYGHSELETDEVAYLDPLDIELYELIVDTFTFTSN